MNRTASIGDLCRRHQNEDDHTEHVARLALALFDGTAVHLGLPRGDRRLLEAAARLHDVGYSLDPAAHAAASASVVMRNHLPGITNPERRDVAAAILLHSRNYRKRLAHPLVSRLRSPDRARRIAAILRVADGLDHTHIQNLSIDAILCRRSCIGVRLSGESATANIPAADAKADLWREVFPLDIRLEPTPDNAAQAIPPLQPHHHTLEAVRRILCVNYRAITDNLAGAVEATDPEPLHDIRVGIRRLCAALRLFRKPLRGTSAGRLATGFRRLNSRLGPIRDIDVWVTGLYATKHAAAFRKTPGWAAYLALQEKRRHEAMEVLRRLLRDRRTRDLVCKAEVFGRIELPAAIRRHPGKRISTFARTQLRKLEHRLSEADPVTPASDPETIHGVRKLCRRARYAAEFFAPVLGHHVDAKAARFKALADALGTVHDVDVAMVRIRHDHIKAPAFLVELLHRSRKRAWREFRAHWTTRSHH